jgi:putative ABC transport system permease protein
MNVRWIKVWRDLWSNRSRTILVILSIAVGVFAIGMIASTQAALTSSLSQQYTAIHPAEAILKTEPGLEDDFVAGVSHMRGIEEAEGRRSIALRLSPDGSSDHWRDMTLYAIPEYDEQRLFQVWPDNGVWPPEKKEVLLERATLDYLGLQSGDEILVKTTDGRKFHLRVTGSVHDLYRIPPVIEGWLYGYISMDTVRWMGLPEGYNELYIDVSGNSETEIRDMTDEVADRIEGEGLPVYQKTLPDVNEHPLNYIIQTILLLLGLLAVLSMFLSGFLVVNVISALLAQQERQIGIMKAIGARSQQIIGLYFGMVLSLGLIACALAIPCSLWGANALAGFTAGLVNFDAPRVEYSLETLLLQLGVGLLIPLFTATFPILNGTRVSPAQVLSEYGINQAWRGAGLVDILLARIPTLPRDLLLAFRNPFRKRGRLILSLVTLTFAGGTFMAIVNLRASLNDSLDQMLGFWRYDAWLVLDGEYPAERLVNEAQTVPGVERTEAWFVSIGRYVRPDGTESANLYLLAPPAGTDMLDPAIIEGRALQPGDTNTIIVSPSLMQKEPDVRLGSEINVKIEGKEERYRIVGMMQMMGNDTIGYMVYMTYDDYARHVREPNRANALIFNISSDTLEEQREIAGQVESRFDGAGIKVVSNFLIAEERAEIDNAFAIIVALLMIMTLLLATVGGLGLMGTMTLNVIERTREIGVMRAYGASNKAIFRIVIGEGLLIGLMSWVLAIGLSVPLSIPLARSIGLSFMNYPMPASYSIGGILAWASLVGVISILSSFFPALRAVRLTVREVLAYE